MEKVQVNTLMSMSKNIGLQKRSLVTIALLLLLSLGQLATAANCHSLLLVEHTYEDHVMNADLVSFSGRGFVQNTKPNVLLQSTMRYFKRHGFVVLQSNEKQSYFLATERTTSRASTVNPLYVRAEAIKNGSLFHIAFSSPKGGPLSEARGMRILCGIAKEIGTSGTNTDE